MLEGNGCRHSSLEAEFNTIAWSLADHEKLWHTGENKYDQKESNAATNVEGSVPYLQSLNFEILVISGWILRKLNATKDIIIVYGTMFTKMQMSILYAKQLWITVC